MKRKSLQIVFHNYAISIKHLPSAIQQKDPLSLDYLLFESCSTTFHAPLFWPKTRQQSFSSIKVNNSKCFVDEQFQRSTQVKGQLENTTVYQITAVAIVSFLVSPVFHQFRETRSDVDSVFQLNDIRVEVYYHDTLFFPLPPNNRL